MRNRNYEQVEEVTSRAYMYICMHHIIKLRMERIKESVDSNAKRIVLLTCLFSLCMPNGSRTPEYCSYELWDQCFCTQYNGTTLKGHTKLWTRAL